MQFNSQIKIVFDHYVEPVQILPRRGYMLVARGKATKERHPGLGNFDRPPSAQEYLKKRLDGNGRKVRMMKVEGLGD